MTTTMRVEFGRAMTTQDLPLGTTKLTPTLTATERHAFCKAYNEIVVDNYSKVQWVQALSVLGPLAGLALLLGGLHLQQQQSHQLSTAATTTTTTTSSLLPCSTLLLGPLVLLISTLTSVATGMFLRQLLVEQLQDLCQTTSTTTAWNDDEKVVQGSAGFHVTLTKDSKNRTYHLVFCTASTTTSHHQVFVGVPLLSTTTNDPNPEANVGVEIV